MNEQTNESKWIEVKQSTMRLNSLHISLVISTWVFVAVLHQSEYYSHILPFWCVQFFVWMRDDGSEKRITVQIFTYSHQRDGAIIIKWKGTKYRNCHSYNEVKNADEHKHLATSKVFVHIFWCFACRLNVDAADIAAISLSLAHSLNQQQHQTVNIAH